MWKAIREMLKVEPLAAVFITAIFAMILVMVALSKIPG